MFIQSDQLRKELKQRLRETREQRWHMSQAEMAEFLRGRLDPHEHKYPSERTYVRWESLNSNELPQSWKKLTAIASVMDVDLSDLIAPVESGETPQFLILRRLDEMIEGQARIEALLTRNSEYLRRLSGEDASPPSP